MDMWHCKYSNAITLNMYFSHLYISRAIHQNVLYHYDDFDLSTCKNCDLNIVWIHKMEKHPWKVTGGTIKECISDDHYHNKNNQVRCWLAVTQ